MLSLHVGNPITGDDRLCCGSGRVRSSIFRVYSNSYAKLHNPSNVELVPLALIRRYTGTAFLAVSSGRSSGQWSYIAHQQTTVHWRDMWPEAHV